VEVIRRKTQTQRRESEKALSLGYEQPRDYQSSKGRIYPLWEIWKGKRVGGSHKNLTPGKPEKGTKASLELVVNVGGILSHTGKKTT